MNTYHKTVAGSPVWVNEEVMAYTIRYPLKNHEYIQGVEIDDLSFVSSIGGIIQDGTLERYITLPKANKVDVVAKGIMLYFDSSKVTETCEKRTFYEGWHYPSCECCVNHMELEEDEYDSEDEQFKLKKEHTRYLVPVPNVRFTVSY